jgi:hypothetical protein
VVDAVDKTRKAEHRLLSESGESVLKGSSRQVSVAVESRKRARLAPRGVCGAAQKGSQGLPGLGH